jgi:hypothetical protein
VFSAGQQLGCSVGESATASRQRPQRQEKRKRTCNSNKPIKNLILKLHSPSRVSISSFIARIFAAAALLRTQTPRLSPP